MLEPQQVHRCERLLVGGVENFSDIEESAQEELSEEPQEIDTPFNHAKAKQFLSNYDIQLNKKETSKTGQVAAQIDIQHFSQARKFKVPVSFSTKQIFLEDEV